MPAFIQLVLIKCLLAVTFCAAAQVSKLPCGSDVSRMFSEQDVNNIKQQSQSGFAPDTCIERTFNVVVWIVNDAYGTPALPESTIAAYVAAAEEDFGRTCFKFNICEYNHIENWQYSLFDSSTEEDDLIQLYHKPGWINLYVTQEVVVGGIQVDGYAHFPGGPDIIVINSVAGEEAFTHELGHFFGLYHTHETAFGDELVNGSNCSVAGDLICDTEADFIGAGLTNGGCNMASNSTDANGDFYLLPTNNLMSNWLDCRSQLTPGQCAAMVQNYLNGRSYLR